MVTGRPWRCIVAAFSLLLLLLANDVTVIVDDGVGAGDGSDVGVGSDGGGIIRWNGKPRRDKQIAIFTFIGFQCSNHFVREQIVGDFSGLCISLCVDNIIRSFLRRGNCGGILFFQWTRLSSF